VSEALRRLEGEFGFGVRWVEKDFRKDPLFREVMMESVVICFTTSQEGWESIARGELLKRPSGAANGWHATLMEGYDLENGWTVAKNTWGDRRAAPRFALGLGALHNWYVIRVFFTLESIRGKITKILPPPMMERFIGTLYGRPIHCAWMDELTATYSSDYVCEPDSSRTGPLRFIGYDLREWIRLNRS
jgi:hypothetical protein